MSFRDYSDYDLIAAYYEYIAVFHGRLNIDFFVRAPTSGRSWNPVVTPAG